MKKQRATLTLIDEGDSFRSIVQYQPSLKDRTVQDNSPSVNAMVRISVMLARGRETMGAPLVFEKTSKKSLTFWQKMRQKLPI